MEEWKNDILKATPEGIWTGREVENGPLYFYQCVETLEDLSKVKRGDIVLTGYACDEGVRRNGGRVGAVGGPDSIKKMLARTTFTNKIFDQGNVHCVEGRMEESQDVLRKITCSVVEQEGLAINIGGGHDIAFATGSGVLDAHSRGTEKIGVLNFDAHFDLRIPHPHPNSGTPFYQLAQACKSRKKDFNYLIVGIQEQSNTVDLFSTAKGLNVDYVLDWECSHESIGKAINKFLSSIDRLFISIDLDAFSAAFAPGVSAVNPLGMHPKLLFRTLGEVFATGKVCAVDIAEMNPKFDIDNRTAKLAARMVNEICRLFLSCLHES